MEKPNELAPVMRDPKEESAGDGNSAQGTGHAQQRVRTKTALDILHSIDQIIAMVALGIMSEKRASALVNALKAQLACLRQSQATTASPEAGGVDAAAECLRANPDMLRTFAPTMSPEALRQVLKRFGPDCNES